MYKKDILRSQLSPPKRVKYLLTPKGIAEKSRLTFEYLQYSLGFYNEIKTLLLNIYKELESFQVKSIVFYGVGEVAELAYLFLQETNIKLVAVIDDNKEGKTFFGFDILKTESLAEFNIDYILLTIGDGHDKAIDEILKNGISKNRIIKIK